MTETELKAAAAKYRYKLAIFSDHADFVSEIEDFNRLLELRAFDEAGEFRAYRDMLCKDFKHREINSENEKQFDGFFDEAQYLDIDTTAAFEDAAIKQATGGGQYRLPENQTMLRVRYYYRFNSEGVAQKCDWRLLGFGGKEEI